LRGDLGRISVNLLQEDATVIYRTAFTLAKKSQAIVVDLCELCGSELLGVRIRTVARIHNGHR
jgi:hypothetical protein